MRKSKKNNGNRVFFIGVGGISMSALAKLTKHGGNVVAGSDAQNSHIVESLKTQFKVFVGHNEKNIKAFKPNLVVYSGAINTNNVELKYAIEHNIPTMERSKFLGFMCKNYKNVIAISGTHGKTTTTAMITEIFLKAGLNPTAHIGGEVKNLDGNLVLGGTDFFITEACEYKKSFEQIFSTLGVVTNIECDHMDCYFNIEDLKNSFAKFLNQAKCCLVNNSCDVISNIKTKKIFTFGKNANFRAENLKNKNGCYSFDCYFNNDYLANFKLNVMGEYNVQNALIAIGVAKIFGISTNVIYDALIGFNGVKRRNENLGKVNGTVVFADYCHHPTEIVDSIENFSKIYKKILCVFQPHTYSRTKTLINDFVVAFKKTKKLIIFKTYAAREEYVLEGSETELFKRVKHKNKQLILDENNLISEIKNRAQNFDCILILGAGDMYDIVKNNLKFD